MSNQEVVKRFLQGMVGQAGSLRSDGEVLKSFNQPIARRVTDGKHVEILLTDVWYSHTTAKQVNMVLKTAGQLDAKVVRCKDVEDGPTPCNDCRFVNCICDNSDYESTEPEEGDYTTEDYRTFYQYGKAVVTVPTDFDPHEVPFLSKKSPLRKLFTKPPEAWQVAIVSHMVKSKFFPDLWVINDHGNRTLVNIYTTEAIRSYV